MAEVIARIKLSKGRVGFYDAKTRIHLTISKPTADIFAGMNTSNIKSAVRDGIVGLVWGSLDLENRTVKKDQHVTEDIVAKVEAAKAARVKAEEEAKAIEAAPVEEVKAEEQPKKEEATVEAEPKATKKKSTSSKKKVEVAKEQEPAVEKAEEAAAE